MIPLTNSCVSHFNAALVNHSSIFSDDRTLPLKKVSTGVDTPGSLYFEDLHFGNESKYAPLGSVTHSKRRNKKKV